MTEASAFSTQVHLTDTDYRALEKKGGIKLSPNQRGRVRIFLVMYERWPYPQTGKRKRPSIRQFDKLGKKIAALIDVIVAMRGKGTGSNALLRMVAEHAGTNPDEALKRLESLYEGYVEVARYRRSLQRGRRANTALPGLLLELERVFKEAGGGATGVARNDYNERESKFVDFAYEALSHLPQHLKPNTWKSLAARWERIYSERKKGKGSHKYDWQIRIKRN
jgi:hypothetical protein